MEQSSKVEDAGATRESEGEKVKNVALAGWSFGPYKVTLLQAHNAGKR